MPTKKYTQAVNKLAKTKGKEGAKTIIAASVRASSEKAKRANPRLRNIKG